MWLLLAFLSATLLGFYDVFKKKALKDNAVLPVLFFNTLFPVLYFFLLFCCRHLRPECWGALCSMYRWWDGKYINLLLLNHLLFFLRGYSGISG